MSFQNITILLILISALGSAIWNIHVKKAGNNWVFVSLMVIPQFLVALPILFLTPLPSFHSLSYILSSAVVQTAYIIFLTSAYKHGLVSRVYPLTIGTAPLISLVYGYLSGVKMLPLNYYGVIVLSAGIMCFVFAGKWNRDILSLKGIFYALSTSVLIFGYSTIDTMGIHTVSNPFTYISWLFTIKAIMLFIPMLFIFREEMWAMAVRSKEYIYAGLLAGFGYSVAITAFLYSETSIVLALRSTSIIFVYFLSIFVLGEKASLRVFLLTLVTSIGVFLILV